MERLVSCVTGREMRMVDKKHALPQSRWVLEEGWQDGFCGSASWLAEGRAGNEPDAAASPMPFAGHRAHCELCAGVGCPALGRVVSTMCTSAISETSHSASSSACLKELPQMFSFLDCLILTGLSTVSSLFWATWKSQRFA